MRRTQEAHVIPVTGNVISCGRWSRDSVVVIDRAHLRDNWNSSPSSRIISVVAAFLEAGRDARGEVALEERGLEGFERALDGVGLLEDVDAVLVLLDHLANALAGGPRWWRGGSGSVSCQLAWSSSPTPWEGVRKRYSASSSVCQPPPRGGGTASSVEVVRTQLGR